MSRLGKGLKKGLGLEPHSAAHKNAATLPAANSTIPSTPDEFVQSHLPVRDTPHVKVTATTTTSKLAMSFQHPINPVSILVAKGWIEHQCFSEMGIVWEEVLASLVKGNKGEETTLWIQRETTNSYTGKPALEILHQIPTNLLIDVEYVVY